MALAALVAALALSPLTAQAFTLINGQAYLYINPFSGYPTTTLQVRATYKISPPTCTAAVFTFTFKFDATVVWAPAVPCNANLNYWDTNASVSFAPPNAAVGNHTISLAVTQPTGPLPGGTASTTYKIVAPPPPRPSPVPSPSPGPTPTPPPSPTPSCVPGAVVVGCPSPVSSPSSAACPAGAAMLPPAGTGGWADGLIATAMAGAVIPIVGFAMFGPRQLMSAAWRRRRLLMLLGLTAAVAFTLSCTLTSNPTAAVTPAAAASPSCSA